VSNPSKQRGTAFETAVVAWLREHGFPYAERRALSGNQDRGDIAGVPGVMLECKAEKAIHLSDYMNEVRVQKANAGAQVGVAVIKRRSHGVERAYVVLELADFVELIK
jgi:Holliday junction resolvase